jgi:hypothetical protein
VVGGISKPITSTLGSITKPALGPVTGSKEEKLEILGGDKSAEDFKKKKEPEPFGGKDQTAQNPLGL